MAEDVKKTSNYSQKSPSVIEYVRPIDRSPDTDFHLRSEEQKKMICHNRAMKQKVIDKIERLQNDVEQRDEQVEIEKRLRKEAEDKLKACLQDMYKNKDVNQELRDRLPRANKSDPFKKVDNDVSETDLSSIEEQIVSEEDNKVSSQQRSRTKKQNSIESQIVKEKKTKSPKSSPKQSPKTSPKSSRRSLNFSGERGSSSSPQNVSPSQSNPDRSQFDNMSPPLRGFYGHHFGASPYLPYTGSLLSGNFPTLSANYSNPVHSTALYPPSALQRPLSSPMLNSNLVGSSGLLERPLSQTLSAPTISVATNNLPAAADGQPSTTTKTGATEGQCSQSSPDSGLGASANFSSHYRHYYPTQRTGNTSILPDPPFLPTGSPRLPIRSGTSLDLDHNKHITSLLNEIDTQRIEASKLRNILQDKESELEILKLTLKVKDVEQTKVTSNLTQAADVVEEVYTAQRKRDDAAVTRMKVVHEERDDILARLQQLEARLHSHRDESLVYLDPSDIEQQFEDEQFENEDMNLLLSRLDSPSSGEADTAAVMKKVEAIKQKQREVTQEEMQIVMEQRDIALAKCRKLEDELLRYQRESEADGGMDRSIKAKLATIQQERDMAVAKSKQLNDEIQTLRIYYSLHKSLSTENSFKQQANDTVNSYQERLNNTQQDLQATQKENVRLVSQLRTVTIDKKQLEQALESVTLDKERLQRLANVLKRKLNNISERPERPEEDHN